MLQASGGSRAGLLKLADQVLDGFDILIEVAGANDGDAAVTSEKMANLEVAAQSNPLVFDQLAAFEGVRPIWRHYGKRAAQLRASVASDGDERDQSFLSR